MERDGTSPGGNPESPRGKAFLGHLLQELAMALLEGAMDHPLVALLAVFGLIALAGLFLS